MLSQAYSQINRRLSRHAPSIDPQRLIAIDLGSHCARLVVRWRRRNGTSHIILADQLALACNGLQQPKDLGQEIHHWLSRLLLPKAIPVACILPRALVEYETVPMPQEVSDLGDFASGSLRELLGEAARQVVHGYWTVNASSHSQSLMHCWTPASFATTFAHELARTGRECIALEPAVPLLAQLGEGRSDVEGQRQLIVHLEDGCATSVSTSHGEPLSSRDNLQLANSSPAEQLNQRLSISLPAAMQLLKQWGIAPSGGLMQSSSKSAALSRTIATCIQPWISEVCFELRRTLRFLEYRHGLNHSYELVLCGEDAEINGLASLLMQELSLPVRSAGVPVGCSWNSAYRFTESFGPVLALALEERQA